MRSRNRSLHNPNRAHIAPFAPWPCAGGVPLSLGNFYSGSGMTIRAVSDVGARDAAQWYLWDGERVVALVAPAWAA